MNNMKERVKTWFKENGVLLLGALFLIVLALFPLFQSGLYRGHDLQFHLSRLDGIITAMQDHQFPLAVYPYKNFGYGYPSPIFYSDTFLIPFALLRYALNLNLITVYKGMLFFFTWLLVFGLSYECCRFRFPKWLSLGISGLLIFSNYYQTDLLIRSALGEIIALSLLPVLIHAAYDYLYTEKENWILLGVAFALLAYSHVITLFLSIITFGLLLLLNLKTVFGKKGKLLALIKATTLGLILSMGFLFPMLDGYTSMDLMVHHIEKDILKTYAVAPANLLNDYFMQFSLRYGNLEGLFQADQMKTLGLTLALAPAGYLFTKKKNKACNDIFALFVLYFLCSSSLIPLYQVPFINFLQFPSRLYLMAMFFAVLLLGYALKEVKGAQLILAGLLIFNLWNISYLHHIATKEDAVVVIPEDVTAEQLFVERIYSFDGIDYVLFNMEEVENGEYLPYLNGVNFRELGDTINTIYDDPIIFQYERVGTKIDFYTNLEEDQWLYLPLTWYKGYQGYELDEAGNVIREIDVLAAPYNGKVEIFTERGPHHYLVKYRGTKIQKVSCLISLAAWTGTGVYLMLRKKKEGVI